MMTLKKNEEDVLSVIGSIYKTKSNLKELVKIPRPDSNIIKEEDVLLPKGAKYENIFCINLKEFEGLNSTLCKVVFEGLKEKGYFIGVESYGWDPIYGHVYIDREGVHHHNVELDIKEFWGDYRIEVCSDFLERFDEFKRLENSTGIDSKIRILFSDDKGFYNELDEKKYPIKNKRKQLIYELRDNDKIYVDERLTELLGYKNKDDIYKYIKEINENFRKNIGFNKYNIILKVDTGGYRLNRDDFDIKFM
jgi:hypothetical protein